MEVTLSKPHASGKPGRKSKASQPVIPKQVGGTTPTTHTVNLSSVGSNQAQSPTERQTPVSHSSTGRISIPNFDASKYGKPSVRRPSQEVHTTAPGRRASLAASIPTDNVSPVSVSVNTLEQCDSLSHSEASLNSHFQHTSLPALSHIISPPPTKQTTAMAPNIVAHHPQSQNNETCNTANTQQAALAPNSSAQNGVKREVSDQNVPQKQGSTLHRPRTMEEKEAELTRLRDIQLTKIGYRNRYKRKPHTAPDSTSLRDLQLARTPLPHDSPDPITPVPERLTNVHTEQDANRAGNGYREEPVESRSVANNAQSPNNTQKSSKKNSMGSTAPQFSVPNWHSSTKKRHPPSDQISNDSLDNPVGSVDQSLSVSQRKTKMRNPKWATTEELKPIQMEIDSNAWGSDVPSNASTADDDSIKPMHHGKLFRHKLPAEKDGSLTGWDGNWQPPPVDWNDRPRFNNNSLEYRNGFDNWLSVTAENKSPDHGIAFVSVPYEIILNLELHADGLDFVPAMAGVTAKNAATRYGFPTEVVDIVRHAAPLTDFEYLEDWGKLDLDYGDNAKLRRRSSNPTSQAAAVISRSLVSPPLPVIPNPEINPHQPKVNIYLRPAVRTDIQQLTDLYNWYVLNSPRTTDLAPIDTYEMRGRFDDCMSARLPFLVAINREHKSLKRVKDGMEKIVGFALATDFAGANQAERISAELEIYVDPKWLNKGVGKCLLDKLLDSTDRGHISNGGCPFTCDPESMHCYNAGGGRDLTTLIFMVRHFKSPNPRITTENDFNTWIKKWLVEKWDFEESGCLKGVGTKFKRLTNITYLCKETKWQPIDGHVPEPLNTS